MTNALTFVQSYSAFTSKNFSLFKKLIANPIFSAYLAIFLAMRVISLPAFFSQSIETSLQVLRHDLPPQFDEKMAIERALELENLFSHLWEIKGPTSNWTQHIPSCFKVYAREH